MVKLDLKLIKDSLTAFFHRAAVVGASIGLVGLVTASAAMATPTVNLAAWEGQSRLAIYGAGFGSKTGTVTYEGNGGVKINSWSDGRVEVVVDEYRGGASTLVLNTVSNGQIALFVPHRQYPGTIGSSIPEISESVSGVSINGGGSQVHVAPGAKFTVTAFWNSYTLTRRQIRLGIQGVGTFGCLMDNKQGNTGGQASVTMTAPTQPGLYLIGWDTPYDPTGCHVGLNSSTDYSTGLLIGSISVY